MAAPTPPPGVSQDSPEFTQWWQGLSPGDQQAWAASNGKNIAGSGVTNSPTIGQKIGSAWDYFNAPPSQPGMSSDINNALNPPLVANTPNPFAPRAGGGMTSTGAPVMPPSVSNPNAPGYTGPSYNPGPTIPGVPNTNQRGASNMPTIPGLPPDQGGPSNDPSGIQSSDSGPSLSGYGQGDVPDGAPLDQIPVENQAPPDPTAPDPSAAPPAAPSAPPDPVGTGGPTQPSTNGPANRSAPITGGGSLTMSPPDSSAFNRPSPFAGPGFGGQTPPSQPSGGSSLSGYGASSPQPGSGSLGKIAGSSDASYNQAANATAAYINGMNSSLPPMGWAGAINTGTGAPQMTGGLAGYGGGGGSARAPNFGAIGGSSGGAFKGPSAPNVGGGSAAGGSGSAANNVKPATGNPTRAQVDAALQAAASGSQTTPGVSASMAAYLANPGGQFTVPANQNTDSGNAVGPLGLGSGAQTGGPQSGAPGTAAAGGGAGPGGAPLPGQSLAGNAAAAGGGSPSSGSSSSPGGLVGSLANTYQTAMNQANAANSQLAGSLMSGYGQMLGGAMNTLGNVTQQQYTDLGNLRDQQQGAAQQNLISRGLGNSTIGSSVASGINQQYAQNLNNLQDSRLQQALGLQTGIEGQQLGALNSFNLNAPNFATLAALAQGVGMSGQNPQAAANSANPGNPAYGGASPTTSSTSTAPVAATQFTVPTIDFNSEVQGGVNNLLQSNAGGGGAVQNPGFYGLSSGGSGGSAAAPSGPSLSAYVNYLQQNNLPVPASLSQYGAKPG